MFRVATPAVLLTAALMTACLNGGRTVTAIATAKEITSSADLIGGPNATGQVGDFLLQNERIRVIIQNADRRGRAPFQYGGNVVDVDRVRFPGEGGEDRFGGLTLLVNGTRTANADKVFILEDGTATGYAVIRAEGDDAIYPGLSVQQFANQVSRPVGDIDPNEALDLIVKTDYILRPGANYLEVRTTFLNRRSAARRVLVGDALDYGSTVPYISGNLGFSLPGAERDFSAVSQTVMFEADGLSYGYQLGTKKIIQAVNHRSTATRYTKAAWVPLGDVLGVFFNYGSFSDVAKLDTSADKEQLLEVPGAGSASYSRYLIVGNGDSGEIFEGVNAIEHREAEFVSGRIMTVDVDGASVPAVGADVAALMGGIPIAHFKADANGQYRGSLPPGTYDISVNLKGHPYPEKASAPVFKQVRIGEVADKSHPVDFEVPQSSLLRIFVKDMSAIEPTAPVVRPIEAALAATVRLAPAQPDPSEDTIVVGGSKAYPFRPADDRLIRVGPSGETSLPLEPGKYTLQGFHGPAYSTFIADVTLREGRRADRLLELARVVPPARNLFVEFGAQTARGFSAVGPEDRIVDSLAHGVELLITTDVGERTDMAAALLQLDEAFGTGEAPTPISDRIGVTAGERVVTPGYGSFSAWPIYPDAELEFTAGISEGFGATPEAILAALQTAQETPVPLAAVDRPFMSPSSVRLGYFDAVDPVVDWANNEAPISVGENAVNPVSVGLPDSDLSALWSTNWTVLNIFSSSDVSSAWLGINAWFALLNLSVNFDDDNQGIPAITATGSPISAEAGLAAGKPVNVVDIPIDNIETFRTDQVERVAAVNAYLADKELIVTNGPLIELLVAQNDKTKMTDVGELLNAFASDNIFYRVTVTAPCWQEVDTIHIFSNAEVTTPTIVNNAVQAMPVPVSTFTSADANWVVTYKDGRNGAEAVKSEVCRADGTGFGRKEIVVEDYLPNVRDRWVVAVATGSAAMAGTVTPLAFTNPVFVDYNGNSQYEQLCPGVDCPNVGTTRLGWYTPKRAATFLP